MAGKEEGVRALVIGGGLAGLSFAAYFENSVVLEARSSLGGFFANDDLKVGNYTGRELVEKFSNLRRARTREAVFEVDESGAWSVGESGATHHSGVPVLATGFREKTTVELGVYGFRPAGVFPLTAAWDFTLMGYPVGRVVAVYGLNHYSLALVAKLSKLAEKVVVVYDDEGSLVHEPGEAVELGAELLKGRISYVEGRDRLERVKTSAGELGVDTLVLAKLAPFRLLGARLAVGNAAMIIEDPWKVVESSRILAEQLEEPGEEGVVEGDVPVTPRFFSLRHPYVILGVPAHVKVEVGGRVITAEEPYPVVELPAEKRVRVRVV